MSTSTPAVEPARAPALPEDVTGAFDRAAAAVQPVDEAAAEAARVRHATLLKPPGSLGRLEDLGVRLAAIAGCCPPPVPEPAALAVFAGDHGVLAQGITPWPASVTATMFSAFVDGGAAVRVMAGRAGVRVVPVDVGIASALPGHVTADRHVAHRIAHGTRDLATGPAMTRAEVDRALDLGAAVAAALVDEGARALLTGEMGIGNTTPTACLLSVFLDLDPALVTGRGTGIDDDRLAKKRAVVAAAVDRVRTRLGDRPEPRAAVAEVGGLELAALAGFVVGGAAAGVPVVVDGIIATASAVVAEALAPGIADRCVAGHRSAEPGAEEALTHLGLSPVLDLGLRLGEGTGSVLALPVLQTAAAVLRDMTTLADAGLA